MSVRWRMVEKGRMAYVSGFSTEPAGDVKGQTQRVLERIDSLLGGAGYDKSRLLTADISLANPALREAHDAAWNDWVDAHSPPLRTCKAAPLEQLLGQPEALVQILVTAAK